MENVCIRVCAKIEIESCEKVPPAYATGERRDLHLR